MAYIPSCSESQTGECQAIVSGRKHICSDSKNLFIIFSRSLFMQPGEVKTCFQGGRVPERYTDELEAGFQTSGLETGAGKRL